MAKQNFYYCDNVFPKIFETCSNLHKLVLRQERLLKVLRLSLIILLLIPGRSRRNDLRLSAREERFSLLMLLLDDGTLAALRVLPIVWFVLLRLALKVS